MSGSEWLAARRCPSRMTHNVMIKEQRQYSRGDVQNLFDNRPAGEVAETIVANSIRMLSSTSLEKLVSQFVDLSNKKIMQIYNHLKA